MNAVLNVISILMSLIFIPLSGLTHSLDLLSFSNREETSKVNIVGLGAYFRSQGITSDGENFYFSSKTTLVKTKKDAKTYINTNFAAISDDLSKNYGIKHIGGISYYEGKIYAGLEDSKVWGNPIIAVYDAESLELLEFYLMDNETFTRGMPWVTVDADSGYLYCADHSKTPKKLLVYNVNDKMNFVKEIELSESIPSIQGAEFHNGTLYCATNDETAAIYTVDISNGNVSKLLDRNLVGGEGEGMTFITVEGKTKLVAIDLGTVFVNTFIRYYDI